MATIEAYANFDLANGATIFGDRLLVPIASFREGARMAFQYVVRRQDNGKYCVWDNKTNAVAVIMGGQGRHENLGLDQALDAATELNLPAQPVMTPTPATEASQQAAQQQQQPQPDDTDKKE